MTYVWSAIPYQGRGFPAARTVGQSWGCPRIQSLVLAPVHKAGNERKGFIFAAASPGAVARTDKSAQEREKVVVAIFGQVNDKEDTSHLYPFQTVRLGFIEDDEEKSMIYKAADVTLVPSMQESLSVIASDSICNGTPVVCFDTSGLPYFVKHRVNGFLAQPYNSEDLGRGLYWSLFQANTSSVRKAAAQIGKELFDARTNTSLLEDAMAEAITRHGDLVFDACDFEEIGEFADSISATNRFNHVYRRSLEKRDRRALKAS